MAEPVRLLVVSLLFCFLLWKLRKLAGMAVGGGQVRPEPKRRPVVQAAVHARAENSAAAGPDPGMPGPDLRPPAEPIWPVHDTADKLPLYGKSLLRLIRQPEMRALLEASPPLKSSLRRLLGLMGTEIPPELAAAPRPRCLPQPERKMPPGPAQAVHHHTGPGFAQTHGQGAAWRLAGCRRDRFLTTGPPFRIKGGGPSRSTRVHFITI